MTGAGTRMQPTFAAALTAAANTAQLKLPG
jgi:hypothetical protein